MRRAAIRAATAVALALVLGAAGGCTGGSATELLETAELEEKQQSLEHARKLYRQIVEQYPGTDQAKRAEARLRALGPEP